MTSKRCRTCGLEKPMTAFAVAKCIGGRRHSCRACANAQAKARREANIDRYKAAARRRYHADPEKQRAYQRERYQANREWWALQVQIARYGLTLDQYHALQERQDFSCAICGDVAEMHIDHCHDTKRIRGLLCAGCNLGLGHFRERPTALVAAAQYLAARG